LGADIEIEKLDKILISKEQEIKRLEKLIAKKQIDEIDDHKDQSSSRLLTEDLERSAPSVVFANELNTGGINLNKRIEREKLLQDEAQRIKLMRQQLEEEKIKLRNKLQKRLSQEYKLEDINMDDDEIDIENIKHIKKFKKKNKSELELTSERSSNSVPLRRSKSFREDSFSMNLSAIESAPKDEKN